MVGKILRSLISTIIFGSCGIGVLFFISTISKFLGSVNQTRVIPDLDIFTLILNFFPIIGGIAVFLPCTFFIHKYTERIYVISASAGVLTMAFIILINWLTIIFDIRAISDDWYTLAQVLIALLTILFSWLSTKMVIAGDREKAKTEKIRRFNNDKW